MQRNSWFFKHVSLRLPTNLHGFSLCSFFNIPSRWPSFSQHFLPPLHVDISEAVLFFTYISQPLPRSSLWPRHPRLGRKRHPASVPRVQPESLLEDVGRQHRDTAHAPIPQRLFRALHRKQHVPGRPGPPQVPRTWTHQERVWFLRSQERWLQTLIAISRWNSNRNIPCVKMPCEAQFSC